MVYYLIRAACLSIKIPVRLGFYAKCMQPLLGSRPLLSLKSTFKTYFIDWLAGLSLYSTQRGKRNPDFFRLSPTTNANIAREKLSPTTYWRIKLGIVRGQETTRRPLACVHNKTHICGKIFRVRT